ncbi:MAG: hypothetical protein DCF25_19325 [Leptolyngbya foveolarum]|uniref:DUF2079 domain-containing protein n=1 Tax=Leptolyngbya foveolarum TaxID=47253 RepID=A0A2W4U2F3_9CYAN|nr:MAG: hypothetical protein DCF25_19325 [Leptolyngbya foveolarum]
MLNFKARMDNLKKFLPSPAHPLFLPNVLLCIGLSVYFILFSFWTVNRSVGWIATGWDDGIYNQLMFNSLHGRWFESSLEMNEIGVTRLGQHFTPAIALLLPI